MEMTLDRCPSHGGRTDGDLFINDVWQCYVLEDEIREIPGVPVAQWKIKGATAIPAGRYEVTLEHSQRFGPDTLTINGVDGFSAIRMHGGNTAADTDGCPMLGTVRTGTGIARCAPAVDATKAAVRAARERGERSFITVNNP